MKHRNLALDSMKVLLALMVVGLHSGFLREISDEANFLTAEGLFRIAVPIFFILNGYFFVTVRNGELFKKWIKRVLYLYIFWMAFYVYFWFRPSSFSVIEVIKLIETMSLGYFHLWYLPGMIGAGIFTFLLKDKIRLGISLSFILFILGVSIQYVGNYHVLSTPIFDKVMNMTFIHRSFLFFGFPFFYIGFVMNYYNVAKNIDAKLLIGVFVLGFGLLLGESWYNYNNPQNDGGFDNYFSLCLICPAIVVLAMRSKLTTENKNLALFSTAIYFIHPFCMAILNKLFELEGSTFTFSTILLSVFLSFFLIKVRNKKELRLSFIL